MTGKKLRVDAVRDEKDLMAFVRFPWEIYQGDRYWVPPLIKDQLSKFSPSHPFLSHSEMALFLAREEDRIVGRIAAVVDHHYVQFQQEKTGFFGFYESIDEPRVAGALMRSVREWLKDRGMEKIAGPMNPSTNDECGLLVDGFDASPCLMMPYNPRYYPRLIEGTGLKKAMDLYAYRLEESYFLSDRLARLVERLKQREPQLRVRSLSLSRLDEELKIVKEIYNDAWSKNWGFVPLTSSEIEDLAKSLKPLVVPDLVLLVYRGEEPVAFSVSLPDYNKVLKHLNGKMGPLGMVKFLFYRRKIDTLRVMLLGVKLPFQKRGVEALLYYETFKRGTRKGYPNAECSWVLERNLLMQHGLEAMGGKRDKTYRIYEASLGPEDFPGDQC